MPGGNCKFCFETYMKTFESLGSGSQGAERCIAT